MKLLKYAHKMLNVWKQILEFFDETNDGTIDVQENEEMAQALRSLGIDVNDNKLFMI